MELGNIVFGNSRGKYPIDREKYNELFHTFLRECSFDTYGYHERYKETYDNSVFRIRPYYWGDDVDIMELPNFTFKPLNLTINWYKYPLRDSYSNISLNFIDFEKMLLVCKKAHIKYISDEDEQK